MIDLTCLEGAMVVPSPIHSKSPLKIPSNSSAQVAQKDTFGYRPSRRDLFTRDMALKLGTNGMRL